MHITADKLVDALSDRGYRITNARRAVCEVVAAAHDEHLSAADIYDWARAKSGTDSCSSGGRSDAGGRGTNRSLSSQPPG